MSSARYVRYIKEYLVTSSTPRSIQVYYASKEYLGR